MNKTELVASYAEKQGISKKDAEVQVDAVFETFIAGVEKDGVAEITKVIRIEKIPTEAREARNPATGAIVQVPAGFKLKATLLKKFKELIGK
jgi:DNA-binding protein HU-beta